MQEDLVARCLRAMGERERERLDEPFGLVVTIVWDFSLQTLWAAATASSSRLGDEIGTP